MLKFKKITVDNATNTKDVSIEKAMAVEVVIAGKTYTISEEDGKMAVRVQGTISIIPSASNSILITDTVCE